MGVPQVYKRSTEGVIASYNFQDIEEGTGVVIYNCAETMEESTRAYKLTTQSPYSNDPLTSGSTSSTSNTKAVDLDFDLTFNLPQNVKGTFMAQIPFIMGHETTANYGGTCYVIMKIIHYDGSTETELGSVQSETLAAANLKINSKTALIEETITAVKHFKKGETLRITLELWITASDSSGSQGAILHDPAARVMTNGNDLGYVGGAAAIDGTNGPPATTKATIFVPFEVDL
jgi:hypothetical protein